MPIKRLYVDAEDIDHPLVHLFSRNLALPAVPLVDRAALFDELKNAADPWRRGKQILWLTRNKGSFFKKCPGTRDYICCGYQILHPGSYCTMDCAYCILQAYFHPPVLQFFLNQDQMWLELKEALNRRQTLRIGTGEFTDSLIWEKWVPTAQQLVKRFASQEYAILELKTKTIAIDNLRRIDHRRKTILAWSLNTPTMIRQVERGTTSLTARLKAAAQAQAWGYPVAFHFDPMMIYREAEEEYAYVIQQLFRHVAADNIAWISLGTLRYMPHMVPIIKQRFPDSNIIYEEFISGLDGKLRYFKPLRIRLYRHVIETIRRLAPDTTVYLCMEDAEVWRKSFGYDPAAQGGLAAMLDHAARKTCGVK